MNKLYRNEDWLYQKYIKEKLFMHEIAKLCKISKSTLCYWMDKLELKRRTQSETQVERNKRKPILYNKEWIHQKYWNEGLCTRKIAILCNTNQRTILNWMIRFGINRRTNSETKMGKGHPCWGKRLSNKTKIKISKANKGSRRSKEARKKISEKVKERCSNPDYTKRMSEIAKKLWQNPAYVKKMLKATNKRPTKPEQLFDKMTPNIVRYVGNRAWWRKLNDDHNHNPDFKVTGQNKVIYVHGNYWHKGENPQDLINLWNQSNLDCLVIWEDEIYKQPDEVLNKVINFI